MKPQQTRNNQIKQVFETADAAGYHQTESNDPIITGQSAVFTTGGARERSTDSDASEQAYGDLKKKKTTVFRQYTRSGENIQEMEQTPQKQKIDELMGRSGTVGISANVSMSSGNESPTKTNELRKPMNKILMRDHVQKDLSVENIRQR